MGEAWNISSHSESPLSTPTAKAAKTRASLRPPIFNPYDKFTQPEFDAWIGDITSALKRALDHEAEPAVDSPSRHSGSWNTVPARLSGNLGAEGCAQSPGPSEVHDEESIFEDSFAQIASRRAKGKARDPREGPGLGHKGQPIELLSDSEEEEEVVDSLEADAVNSEDSDDVASEGETDDDVESDVDEGGEVCLGQPGTSAQHIVTRIPSDGSVHDQGVVGRSEAKPRHIRDEGLQFPRNSEMFLEDGGDGKQGLAVPDSIGGMNGEFPIPSQDATPFDVELVDPWDGPRTFAEDYYSGGDRLAPGLTPNRLTPISRSPAPTLPVLQITSNAGPNEDKLSPSSSVLSTSLSPQPQDTVNEDDIDEFLQYGTTVATSVDQEEIDPVTGSYYDRVGVVDVTAHDDTEPEAVESAEGVNVIKARLMGKGIATSYSTRSNVGTNGRDPNRGHKIIWALPSDDEDSDAGGEEDEGKFLGVAPLGTSDLDIRDWHAIGRPKDADYTSEEDELLEMAPTQTADDIAKTAALTLSQFSEVVNPRCLDAPLAGPQAPVLASTFQLTDTDSFGDLPVSSPPSEAPSPAPVQPAEAFGLQQQSIEQLLADLEREASEKRSQVSEPLEILARQPEAEAPNSWASRELENILSSGNVGGDTGSAPTEHSTSQEAAFSTQFPEYIVEEIRFGSQVSIPDDDLGDTRSIPPPDLAEVAEMVQLYEVEEPRTDGRLTEGPEITITSSLDDDSRIVLSLESTAIPITADQQVCPISPMQELSHPSREPASAAGRMGPFTADPNIPAPIFADPSVPDPVPGESYPPSPLVVDSRNASELSIVPPAVRRVIDHDPSQMSSGTSGLFTPAQRSGGGTPIQLEDETAHALTIPHNRAEKDLEAASIFLQAEGGPSAIKSSVAGREHGGNTEDKDAMDINELIRPRLISPDGHQSGIGAVDVGAQSPRVDAVKRAEVTSPPIGHGFAKPTLSQSSEANSTLRSDAFSGVPFKMPAVHVDILDPDDRVPGTPTIAEGDEDADGEADPDYSSALGTNTFHPAPAHQPVGEGREVVSSKTSNDIVGPKEISSELENLPTSASSRKQETESVEETPPNSQDKPTAESRDAQDEGDFTCITPSKVKTSHGRENPTQTLKRKRRDPKPGPVRMTRSRSGASASPKKTGSVSSSHQPTVTSEKSPSDRVGINIEADSVDDGASEAVSVSSGASAVRRLLHATSRAGSVDSSASGDAPRSSPSIKGPGKTIPLTHSHGAHHHGWFVPPPLISPTTSSASRKSTRPEQAKSKSSTPEPSTPSLKKAPSVNSPVTRSNCRFHKISLPRGQDGVRAYFVVPGCALGDGELMDGEDIRDEGYSTQEDHKRMLPNVETLDLSPYLIGVLRHLVGVDLLREQQEIFYLPSGDEKPKKRRQTSGLESLRQFRRQSISSGGPLARDRSPQPSEISHYRGSSTRSASGSAASASVREESVVHSEDGDDALSDLDKGDDPGESPPVKRHKISDVEMVPPPENTPGDELGSPAVPEHPTVMEKEQAKSSRLTATRRSKRKNLSHDAAAYKPHDDEVKEDEVEETKMRRSRTRRTKRSRTMEESSANPPRSKKMRLGRSISVAGAGAIDSKTES